MMVYNIGNLLPNIVDERQSVFDNPIYIEIVVGLDDSQQVQNDEDGGNNEQCVDPTTCLRETWAYAPTEIAE
jgi:hypothetical protein